MLEENTLEIYVDGSVKNNNGVAAVKVLFIDLDGNESSRTFVSPIYQNVKSTQMEIIACTYALEEVSLQKLIDKRKQIYICTDSKYVSENYREAMFHWVGNQWREKFSGRPVSEAREWKELVNNLKKYYQNGIIVKIKWVKGHHKNQHNLFVDGLAKTEARLPIPLSPKNKIISTFAPKLQTNSSRPNFGSIKIYGQDVSIRILSCERLSLQRLWSYRYEVISKEDAFYKKIDKIYAKFSLDVGKSYFVKFNSSTNNPRIEKVYREIL